VWFVLKEDGRWYDRNSVWSRVKGGRETASASAQWVQVMHETHPYC
jgi:hypothetical protein